MGYKSFYESSIVDDLIGISLDAKKTFPDYHHLHIEFTGSCDVYYNHVTPGSDSPSDVKNPVISGITIVENGQALQLDKTVEFRYNQEEIDGLFAYMKNLFTDPRVRIIYQIKPRLIVIIDPIEGFPFRAEISSHELELDVLVNLLTNRESLYDWLFKSDRFGRRLTVYLTPAKLQSEEDLTPEMSNLSRKTHMPFNTKDPMRSALHNLGMQMQAETAREMGAHLPTPGNINAATKPAPEQQPDDTTVEQDNRLNQLLAEAEQSVENAKGADIPTVPLHAGEGNDPTEAEKRLIDAKSRASLDSIRQQNEAMLRSMLDDQLRSDSATLPGIPPSGAFKATPADPSAMDTPGGEAVLGNTTQASTNEEMPAEEASETVKNLFGEVDSDEQK